MFYFNELHVYALECVKCKFNICIFFFNLMKSDFVKSLILFYYKENRWSVDPISSLNKLDYQLSFVFMLSFV